ncbi:hypothetical protein [Mycolicibacterium phlei]
MRTQLLFAAAVTVGGLTGAPVALAQEADVERCDPQAGRMIAIVAGNIDCVTASRYAAQYDPAGAKYQVIGPFTCYSGTAQTAPLLFQCTSPVEGGTEFAVYPG